MRKGIRAQQQIIWRVKATIHAEYNKYTRNIPSQSVANTETLKNNKKTGETTTGWR